jgi:hypothetical protein
MYFSVTGNKRNRKYEHCTILGGIYVCKDISIFLCKTAILYGLLSLNKVCAIRRVYSYLSSYHIKPQNVSAVAIIVLKTFWSIPEF